MPLDWKRFAPTVSTWFDAAVEFRGAGRAEFLNPPGVVEGPVTVRFDELGHESIEMQVEHVECDRELRFGAEQFLSGGEPVRAEDGGWSITYSTKQNTCTSLRVLTDEGVFSSVRDNITFKTTMADMLSGEPNVRIQFRCPNTIYTPAKAGPADSWVLPLINFTADIYDRHPSLARHPLPIYPVPSIPTDLSSPQDLQLVMARAWSKSQLSVFAYKDGLGFIERLADYQDRKERLDRGQERALLTAVLVGPLGGHSIEESDLYAWFPFDLVDLLGFETAQRSARRGSSFGTGRVSSSGDYTVGSAHRTMIADEQCSTSRSPAASGI